MQNELDKLQTLIAFQEQTISELNAALTGQQAQIDRLELKIKLLNERMDDLEEAPPGGDAHEIPPHY